MRGPRERLRRVRDRRHRRDEPGRGEAGETLIEVLITLALLSIAIVVIIGAMAQAIQLSANHRDQAVANTLLTSEADLVKTMSYDTSNSPSYAPSSTGLTFPAGWSIGNIAVGPVQCADTSNNWSSSCPGAGTLQKVTVTVTSPRGFAVTLDVVKRSP